MSKGNIVITGVSTGIGLHLSKKFTHEGYKVFGSVRNDKDAKHVAEEAGPSFEPLIFDVTDDDAICAAAKKVEDLIGNEGIELLVNNAGIAIGGPTSMLSMEDYRYQFDVNFFGLIATTKAFLPLLGAAKDCAHAPGKIYNISSVAGKLVYPFMGPYSASKHAVEGFSQALRRELMIYGIDVVIIGPGPIKTAIWGKAEKIDEKTAASDYGSILINFRDGMMKEAKLGMEAEDLADKVYQIFLKPRPKTRYTILKDKFKKWTIPQYFLSDRQLDKIVKRMLKM